MSFNAMAWAWETPVRWPVKPVLLALANRMNDKTGQCNPSLALLASDVGQSKGNVRAIRRAVTELRDLGYIEVFANYAGKGQQTSNSYRLNVGFIHQATETRGRTESPRGSDSPPPSGERPVRPARAVGPPRTESPGVGTESPTNQELNPSSLTTEEVLRTRESEDLDDLEALMVEEREVCSPNQVSDSAGSHKVPGGGKVLAGSGEQRPPRPTVDDFLAAMAEREAS